MSGTNKFKTRLSQILPNCSEKTEEINQCIIRIIAKLLSQYPREVDVSGIIVDAPHQELSIRVIEMLVQDGIFSGTINQMQLTLAGYSAVNGAMTTEPRLAVALWGEDSSKIPYDHTALLLSILRVYATRQQRK